MSLRWLVFQDPNIDRVTEIDKLVDMLSTALIPESEDGSGEVDA